MDSINMISENDAIKIIRSDGVFERLKVNPVSICSGDCYCVNNRMLLILIEYGENVDAHIGQPRKHWKYIHEDIQASLRFIKNLGYKNIYTNVNSRFKTTLNLVKKHGFNKIDMVGSEVLLKWA